MRQISEVLRQKKARFHKDTQQEAIAAHRVKEELQMVNQEVKWRGYMEEVPDCLRVKCLAIAAFIPNPGQCILTHAFIRPSYGLHTGFIRQIIESL